MKHYFLAAVLLFSVFALFAAPLSLTGNVETDSVLNAEGILAKLLAEKSIKADAVLLTGKDGTAAFIEKSAFKVIFLQNKNQQWNSVSDSLPPVCNIKNLAEIAISYNPWDIILEVDIDGTFPKLYTPFAWIMADFRQLATSSKNGWQAEKYIRAQNPLLASFLRELTLEFCSGEVITTMFQPDKFFFDGYSFRYDGKPLKKIFRD